MKVCFFLFASIAAFLPLSAHSAIGKKIPAEKVDALVGVYCVSGAVSPVEKSGNAEFKKTKAGFEAVYTARSGRWREMKFKFTVDDDMKGNIYFRAAKRKTAVFFDDLKLNGKPAWNGDFQKGFDNWALGSGKPRIREMRPKFDGDKCALVASWHSLSKPVEFKKGAVVELSIMVLASGNFDDCHTVDFSGAANADAGSLSAPFSPIKTAPKKCNADVAGMKFALLADGENNAIVPLMSPSRTVKIDLSKAPPSGKYIYILHALGGSGGGNVGKITTEYCDGRVRASSITLGSDIASSKGKPRALDNAIPVYSKKGEATVYMSRFDVQGADKAGKIKKMAFDSYKNWVVLAATVSSREVSTTENMVFDPEVWKPLAADSYEVKEGSALDFSAEVQKFAPAGKFGRVVVGDSGNFEFENRRGIPVRFKAANFFSLICGFTKTIKTHEQIDRYVAMLKKQGFNALRWRFLMDNEFESPYKLKPLNRDLYDYFLYALGREGIYSFFYLCSHDTGDPSFTWNDRFTVKVKMMLGDPATREAWRKLAKMQLEHVNPYTGKKWKDDPSIATIEYWNEFELGISSYPSITEEGKKLAREKFGEYLAKRYKTPADFLADCEKMGTPWKQETAPQKFSDIDLSPYDNRTGNPVYARFIVEAMTDMQAFCEKVVREEIGMKIPTHQNNCVRSSFWAYLSSIGGDYTAINVYHCHPSSYSLGAQVPQKSSIADEASYWRASAAKRVAGMPLAITEYQHCYFNKYVHELGVLFSSYAALQGYGALVEFDSPVAENPAKFGFFGIGTNPIMRANDFLTYFLFYRGDVKASPHRTELVLDKNFIEKGTTLQLGVNQEQSKIALMTGFALSFPDGRKLNPACGAGLKPADLKLAPIGGTEINTSQNFASAGKTFDKGFKTRDILPALKGKGILPEGNVSDPDNGVFQSDTGEIVLRAKSREMSVAAEKSAVAVVNEDTKPQTLGAFRINSFNRKGAIGIVSIDGEPLEKSSRMVLVISTDAVPTGVGLSSTRLKIISWGKPPALIETGALSAALKVGEGRRFDIYPLKISGERLEKIPAKVEGGELKLEIDTSKNPSLYFEIVESKGGE